MQSVDILLHIGVGKCGSSALQTYLSKNSEFTINHQLYKKLKYIVIDKNGNLLEGNALKDRVTNSIGGYITSCCAIQMKNFSKDTFNSLNTQLRALSNNNENLLVMSWEGWAPRAKIFQDFKLLNNLGVKANVICYVRNPVEWINSAWWQWGAWSGKSIDDYISWSINERITNWPKYIDEWKKLDCVKNVSVRLLPKDIIIDFNEYIGHKSTTENNRNNTSLPGEILRFYQKHKELRPSEHESRIDFILSNVLEFDKTFQKTPWVLDLDKIQNIITKTKNSNNKLLEHFDSTTKIRCRQDSKWWDIKEFKDKNFSASEYNETYIAYDQLDKLLLQSFKCIEKLYLENLALQKKC